mmetsp:Transcript_5270/g.12661  ORF Transcript_5270/g.12661 Transcript_5270/m.12661 type:complete len:99 (+) Transcript_5270:190-486(+)
MRGAEAHGLNIVTTMRAVFLVLRLGSVVSCMVVRIGLLFFGILSRATLVSLHILSPVRRARAPAWPGVKTSSSISASKPVSRKAHILLVATAKALQEK